MALLNLFFFFCDFLFFVFFVPFVVTILRMKSYEVIQKAVDEPGVKAVAAALKKVNGEQKVKGE